MHVLLRGLLGLGMVTAGIAVGRHTAAPYRGLAQGPASGLTADVAGRSAYRPREATEPPPTAHDSGGPLTEEGGREAPATLALAPAPGAPAVGSPSTSQAFVADRLFFGRAIPGGGSVLEEDWATFLHEVVTPRFSDGLTIWRAEGQWADRRGRIVLESVMVVEILHPADDRAETALAEIAREYRRRFRQEAVLRVSSPAQIRFHE